MNRVRIKQGTQVIFFWSLYELSRLNMAIIFKKSSCPRIGSRHDVKTFMNQQQQLVDMK